MRERSKILKILSVALPLSLYANLSVAEGTEVFVAGVHPEQRPAGAPVIQEVKKDRAWYDSALTGVSPPFPASLIFLDVQGNWYTPFTRPGMRAPYDLRGWHSRRTY
jgi:hypothetical protein